MPDKSAITSVPLLPPILPANTLHTSTLLGTTPLLAADASAAGHGQATTMVLGTSATIVPKKLIQKIIRLEFIEMSDLLPDNVNSDDNLEDKDSKWGKKTQDNQHSAMGRVF